MNKNKARQAGISAKAICAATEKKTGIKTSETAKALISALIKFGRGQNADIQQAHLDCDSAARSWNVNPAFPSDVLAIDAYCVAVGTNVRFVGDSTKKRMGWESTSIWNK